MQLKLCPRVHFKAVIVDGAWIYLGSANLTCAGLESRARAVTRRTSAVAGPGVRVTTRATSRNSQNERTCAA